MSLKRKNSEDTLNEKCAKQLSHMKASLNNELKETVSEINRSWLVGESLVRDNIALKQTPFKHCIVDNVINDEQFLKQLKEELVELEFVRKHNDLYQFHQSLDLLTVDKPMINSLRKFLKDECRSWLQEATGITLNDKISSTCSSYNFSDHLLCHDDKCEDRRIAFVLYLNENWSQDYGGCLQLFDTDERGQPNKGVSGIWPKFNSFVFFEVTDNSFHQVCEVTAMDQTRLTVNGWFHGALREEKMVDTSLETDICLFPPVFEKNGLTSHLNKMYLHSDVQQQISTSFEQDSEILLPNFFNSNFYNELCECLANDSLSWKMEGPANRRKYETLNEKQLPVPLEKLVSMFRSAQFFELLGELTSLDLKANESDDKLPYCSYEIQRWKKGFYTLIRDDQDSSEFALDVVIYCNTQQTKQLQGGFISYIARNADEELLTLLPSQNALAMAFRDKETLRFMKYINHAFSGCFQTIIFTYHERPSSVTSGDQSSSSM